MFQKICGFENVTDEKEGYHDFPSKLLCLTVPNLFPEEPFCVPENFGNRKVLCLRR